MLAVANKYQGKPIAFIAVNSGNSPRTVAKYLNENQVFWPTIVDPDRLFEQAVGMSNPISLKNIWQFRGIDATGSLKPIGSGNLEQEIDSMLAEASWNVDPESIPAELQETWLAVEFGNFAAASKTLNRSLKSRKPETKAAADSLNAFVQTQLQNSLARAADQRESGEEWLAFKAYTEIEQKFEGFEIPDLELEQVLRELKISETVKTELAAHKELTSVGRLIAKSGPEKAVSKLKRLIDKYPNTEAAQSAQQMLGDAGK